MGLSPAHLPGRSAATLVAVARKVGSAVQQGAASHGSARRTWRCVPAGGSFKRRHEQGGREQAGAVRHVKAGHAACHPAAYHPLGQKRAALVLGGRQLVARRGQVRGGPPPRQRRLHQRHVRRAPVRHVREGQVAGFRHACAPLSLRCTWRGVPRMRAGDKGLLREACRACAAREVPCSPARPRPGSSAVARARGGDLSPVSAASSCPVPACLL
jgi:hypothetical protein